MRATRRMTTGTVNWTRMRKVKNPSAGDSWRFGYVNFKSADDQEKALELSDTKVLGFEIKFKKPKRKETKVCKQDQNAKTLLLKNLPDKVIPHETLLVFEDAFQIRLVSKDGMSKREGKSSYPDFCQ
ncbi:nucleolin-like isoform X2 [Trachypithecus francoisi]|uniref:nucleolin-like isoform X2 n=1 Tax=Trachypithecus francoisi TaxID=54180 RepID=UPI00141A9548|nr:nucleolin-like isoform X2 [Trachypithecus francoisi]